MQRRSWFDDSSLIDTRLNSSTHCRTEHRRAHGYAEANSWADLEIEPF